MKKLYIILALIMSSFFFYSSDVRADTTTYEVIESEFNNFTEDFSNLRELTIANLNETYSYYIILYHKSKSRLTAYLFESTSNAQVFFSNGIGIYLSVSGAYKNYYLNGSNFTESGSGSNYYSTLCSVNGTTCTYLSLLDTNFDLSYTSGSTFNIKYNDLLYEITVGSKVPNLYEIYLDSIEVPDIHEEEKQILSNFYNLVIEKIVLLSNYIINNYIFLSFVGIIILIFLIELIRRYLL